MERAIAVAVALCSAAAARADTGDVSVGPAASLAWGSTDQLGFGELRLQLQVDVGLSQFWSLRGQVGGAFGVGASGDIGAFVARGLASGGVVFAYDVWTWVPELHVYGGLGSGSTGTGARVGGTAGVRTYFSRRASFSLFAGAEYDWAVDVVVKVIGICLSF